MDDFHIPTDAELDELIEEATAILAEDDHFRELEATQLAYDEAHTPPDTLDGVAWEDLQPHNPHWKSDNI